MWRRTVSNHRPRACKSPRRHLGQVATYRKTSFCTNLSNICLQFRNNTGPCKTPPCYHHSILLAGKSLGIRSGPHSVTFITNPPLLGITFPLSVPHIYLPFLRIIYTLLHRFHASLVNLLQFIIFPDDLFASSAFSYTFGTSPRISAR